MLIDASSSLVSLVNVKTELSTTNAQSSLLVVESVTPY